MNKAKICSACGKGKLGNVRFRIDNLPYVDSFMPSSKMARSIQKQTVSLHSCNYCNTVQIKEDINPKEFYTNYIYSSSSSPDLVNHFTEYALSLHNKQLVTNSNILEIGINDGLLYNCINKFSPNIYFGVDPSPQTKSLERSNKNPKLKIINDYFSEHNAFNSLEDQKFNLIIANNVLSHIPNLNKVFSLIEKIGVNQCILVFEVQSLYHMITNSVFDYIYHEHIFYHSISSLENLLDEAELRIFDISFHLVKGGSYRVFVCKKNATYPKTNSLDYYKMLESIVNINDASLWNIYSQYIEEQMRKCRNLILQFKDSHTLIGYGACATGTVLIEKLGIGDMLEAIVDDNKLRQNLFTPGYATPVVSSESLKNYSNPLVICLAWRHYKYYRTKLDTIPHIIPLPFLSYVQ